MKTENNVVDGDGDGYGDEVEEKEEDGNRSSLNPIEAEAKHRCFN